MTNKNDSILVSISADNSIVSFKTFDRINGSSHWRFVMLAEKINEFVSSHEYSFYDYDCGNFLKMCKQVDGYLWCEVTYLDRIGNKVEGRVISFYIPEHAFSKSGKYLCSTERRNSSKLLFSDAAHELIASFNKLQRRALSKALRDNFKRSSVIEVYRDLGLSFFFKERDGIHGGLVMHESYNNGRTSYHFSVHT